MTVTKSTEAGVQLTIKLVNYHCCYLPPEMKNTYLTATVCLNLLPYLVRYDYLLQEHNHEEVQQLSKEGKLYSYTICLPISLEIDHLCKQAMLMDHIDLNSFTK